MELHELALDHLGLAQVPLESKSDLRGPGGGYWGEGSSERRHQLHLLLVKIMSSIQLYFHPSG